MCIISRESTVHTTEISVSVGKTTYTTIYKCSIKVHDRDVKARMILAVFNPAGDIPSIFALPNKQVFEILGRRRKISYRSRDHSASSMAQGIVRVKVGNWEVAHIPTLQLVLDNVNGISDSCKTILQNTYSNSKTFSFMEATFVGTSDLITYEPLGYTLPIPATSYSLNAMALIPTKHAHDDRDLLEQNADWDHVLYLSTCHANQRFSLPTFIHWTVCTNYMNYRIVPDSDGLNEALDMADYGGQAVRHPIDRTGFDYGMSVRIDGRQRNIDLPLKLIQEGDQYMAMPPSTSSSFASSSSSSTAVSSHTVGVTNNRPISTAAPPRTTIARRRHHTKSSNSSDESSSDSSSDGGCCVM